MATTELEDVQALLERALPDPFGFAQRLLLQFMAQRGNMPEADRAALFAPSGRADAAAGRTSVPPDEPATQTAQVDTNMLLAAALGACECWGLRADCDVCAGEGGTGWILPDRELFEELVKPAVVRLAGESAGGTPDATPDHDRNDPPTEEEVAR